MKIPVFFKLCLAVTIAAASIGHADAAQSHSSATKIGKARLGCAEGSFFDLAGNCWRCPNGFNHDNIFLPPSSGRVCKKAGRRENRTANKIGGSFAGICTRGWLSLHDGNCYRCPRGYRHNPSKFGNQNGVCFKQQSDSFSSARRADGSALCSKGFFDPIDGGSCWTCPSGFPRRSLSSVKTDKACMRNACGGEGDRPCLITERIPSCDKRLSEDFSANKCVKLRAGETPFTAGLASLLGEVSKTSEICEQSLLAFPSLKTKISAIDVGARCSSNLGIGFTCALPKGVEKIKDTIELMHKFNRQYDSSPCKDQLSWYTQRAVSHGSSRNFQCDRGQFFDLIDGGSCWSCPLGFSRSLASVKSESACFRATGSPGALRSICAAFQTVTQDADEVLKCIGAIIRSGHLPAAFEGEEREMCLAAGEQAYFTALDVLTATTTRPKTRLELFVKRMRSADGKFGEGQEANEFIEKIEALRECEGVFAEQS